MKWKTSKSKSRPHLIWNTILLEKLDCNQGVTFSKFSAKGGNSDSSRKKGGVGKTGRVVLKKGGSSWIIFHTNPLQSYLCLSDWWCFFCLFTPYLSVFFVFHAALEEVSLIESNQQTYKSVILEKQRHFGTPLGKLLILANNTDSCLEHIAGGVSIYLYGCISPCVCWVSLFVLYQLEYKQKPCHMLDLSKRMPCCLKHTRSLWYQDTKAPHVQIHNIIK